jgi:hypothetical protein
MKRILILAFILCFCQPIFAQTTGLLHGGTNQTAWTSSRCVQVAADGSKLESASAACGSGTGSGGSGPNYGVPFTGQTVVTILGTTHKLGTKNLIVACYDDANPANALDVASHTVDGSSYDVIVTFLTPQSGYCVVNGSGPAVYSTSESPATTWSIPAATHGLGTALQVREYDTSGDEVEPAKVNVDGSGNVTVTWAVAQEGTVVITQ